jgi:hypothetical protein
MDPASMLGFGIPGLGGMPGSENNPQNKGFGIGAPGYFEPYSSGSGIQGPQGYGFADGGGDFTQRGMGENMFAGLGAGYTRPGLSEGYAAKQLQQHAGGMPGVSNNQQTNYESFQLSKPQVATEAGLDPYYDRARERQTAALDNQLAARGLSTSSGGIGLISDAMKDLNAEQANREADYRLRAMGEQRAWEGLGGQLAGGADSQSNAASQNELAWTQGLGSLAGNADQAGMYRLNSGMNAANQAQQLEQDRWQQLLGNEMAMGDRMSGLMGNAYNDMLGTDQNLMEQSMNMNLGLGAEALNQDYNTSSQRKEDVMDLAGMAMGFMGGI